ncbi:type III-A CRISPR-associated protein Cas10/Csm1 [Pleomorphovibrio marinus]|uniref:type III-A CRISPR-associated protein Cas10/Csm1 n=1 Tax=Pleomorphovibrio marinus TaxID=2164132 RepID=UPI001300BD4C|nr:type III-A CRISPR-associated protein Cas10/Csm1 [Pleomorphovibrio marinus]
MNKRNIIYLAALLHDIGKFFQRADPNPYWESEILSETSKKLSGVICPQKKGYDGSNRPTHHHVIWTHEFFEIPNVKKHFRSLGLELNPFDLNTDQEDHLINLSVFHHRPYTKLQALIQMADHWASGLDRTKKDEITSEKRNFKEVGLLSVFSQIEGKDKRDFYLRTRGQSLEAASIMPSITEEVSYSDLWEEFIVKVGDIPMAGKGQISAFTESLLFLLRKYTSSVSASTFQGDLPSVSLFDHLRVTAAIADALFAYAESYGFDEVYEFQTGSRSYLKLKPNHKEPLLMACVDLSGIQSFIYNISGTKAAQSLKGRSFYLQLLIDSIIDRLVLDNGLSIGNVLYSSGGKAYLLMPNTTEVKSNIKKLHQEIIKNVYNEHGFGLYVCMDFVSFGYDQELKVLFESTQADHIGELWKVLGEKTGKQKQRKYDLLLNDSFERFFVPEKVIVSDKICAVTGKPLEVKEAKNISHDDSEEPVYVSPHVYELITLGKQLKDADFIISFSSEKTPQFKRVKGINPLKLGIKKYLFDQEDLTKEDADFRKITSFDFCRVQYINNTSFELVSKLKGQGASYGYLFYGGNEQAEKENGEEKLFDELAESGSFDRLGVLRMDVDNLGDLFIRRIPENQRNLATYATLSSQLDIFFSGYLNIIRKKDTFKDYVNILYSGGDDIFAIGRWKELVDFAMEVRKSFEEFIGGRKDITLSAGISLVKGKYPIAKAADLAGEAEEAAKVHGLKDGKANKDAFTFLGTTLSWMEMGKVAERKSQFVKLYENGVITMSLLQKLMQYHLQKEGNPYDFSYIWRAVYFLKRYKAQGMEAESLKEELTKDIMENAAKSTVLQELALAARWAELEIRTFKQKSHEQIPAK